jgi:pimeloyl-ACP methyl ester carboxylesterase
MWVRHLCSRGMALASTLLAVVSAVHGHAQVAPGGAPAGVGRMMARIEEPKSSGCITDVSPGDHTYSCDGIIYRVMVDEMCTRLACGLIFDIHGAGMSAEIMRANTGLHKLAPSKGYLVVHPSAAPTGIGSWNFETSPPKMADFMFRMIDVFHVDKARIHVTGFSMGAAMTFSFLCSHNDILASTAVVTGQSADQVRAPDGTRKCIDAIDANWQPRVPILFMNGVLDPALTPTLAHARRDGIVSRLSLTGGEKIAGDSHYTRTRWTGMGGMVFDFLEHDYSAEGKLAGHCMPGGTPPNATTCTKGEIKVNWGETALQWFIDHPKRQGN